MRHFLTLIFALIFLPIVGYSQHEKVLPPVDHESAQYDIATKSALQLSDLFMVIEHSGAATKWATSVRGIEGSKHGSPEAQIVKAGKEKIYSANPQTEEASFKTDAVVPEVGMNYEANWSVQSTPPDNTIAISNAGIVVTANNDGIEYYNSSGQMTYFDFWDDFFNDPQLTASLYDPKVLYDSGSDRFILIVLHGSSAATTRVLVSFSQTNDPSGGWYVYQLTGNALNNGTWFDFPNIGVSNNELYVTGNLYDANDDFDQSILYQIPKAPGYSGGQLNWQYWTNFGNLPYTGFTLVPASFGQQGNYGPGIYLVSNRSGGSNQVRLFDLTDDLSGNPQLNSFSANLAPYTPAPDAEMLGTTDLLSTNDSRIMSAFYLDGVVHYVFHSDIGNGWSGINYNRLTVQSLTNQASTFGLSGSFDYAYPNLASFGTSQTDRSVMISFLRSSATIYPEFRVVNCDELFNWSNSTQIKSGETYIDFLSGTEQRWGDYIGISRKHNAGQATVWVAGCYGADIPGQGNNTYKTWVAEITGGATVGIDDVGVPMETKIFPNPVYDMINIEFEVEVPEMTSISIIDVNGAVVKELYQDVPKQGLNRLRFNKDALSAGTYVISIQTESKEIKNEQVVVLD